MPALINGVTVVAVPPSGGGLVKVVPVPGGGGGGSGSGLPSTFVARTTAYTAAAGEFVLANATSAGFTVTLPAAPSAGDLVTVKKTDASANIVTVVGQGGDTIDGEADAQILTEDAGGVFSFDGSNWQVEAVMSASGGGSGAVTSVAGRTGVVVLTKSDVGLSNVDNTADASKPVSTLQAAADATVLASAATDATTKVATETSRATTAEGLLAPKASPALTGVPTSPTAAGGTNTTQVATTAFVTTAVAGASAAPLGIVAYSPGSATTVATTSATMADLDATNLAVTFTVPASGKVLVTLNGWVSASGGTTTYNWGIRESTTTITETGVIYNGGAQQVRVTALLYVTGLTPAASLTWKWAHRLSFGAASSATTWGGATANAAVMVVTAA